MFLRSLKALYIRLYKFLFGVTYYVFSFVRQYDENKVIIALYRGNHLEGNLQFVSEEIRKQLPNAKIHLISGENKMNLRLFKEAVWLANARFVILDDYYLPVYLVTPRKRLKVIQLWHAAGAFKKFGYSTVGTKFGADARYLKLVPIHSHYTHVYVSSERISPFYAEAFHMNEEKVIAIGTPRTDLFQQKQVCLNIINVIKQEFSELQDDRVNILFAPTYRAKGNQGETEVDNIEVIRQLADMIDSDKRIIFKPHPYVDTNELNDLQAYPNVLVANVHTINEWMLLADAFITDYSSSVFEFALLKRPIAHYIPDVEQYRQNRGFYQDVNDVSNGEKLYDLNQLVNWINDRYSHEKFDTSRMIHYNFDNIDNVTEKIVAHFVND